MIEPAVNAETATLFEAIRAAPADLAPYLVLADVLQAHGDPRGELMAIQHVRALADTPELLEAEQRLVETHREHLLGKPLADAIDDIGSLTGSEAIELEWRLGHLHRIRAEIGGRAAEILALVEALFAAPAAMVLASFDLQVNFSGQPEMDRLLDLIADAAPPSLRELRVASANCQVLKLHEAWARLPRLRSLRIGQWGGLDLGDFDLPDLEDLELIGPKQPTIETILTRPPPRLRRLYLDVFTRVPLSLVTPLLIGAIPSLRDVGIFGNEEDLDVDHIVLGDLRSLALGPVTTRTLATILNGSCAALERLQLHFAGDVTRDSVQPILDGALPALRELYLGAIDGESFVRALVDAPILPRLEVVDLVDLTDDDLAFLADHADRFAHLQQLRFVTPPGFGDPEHEALVQRVRDRVTVVFVENRVIRSVRDYRDPLSARATPAS